MKHLEAAGFSVETEASQKLNELPTRRQVPETLRSCHTATFGGYILEGHVPATVMARLLRERPDVVGIAVPAMPAGSPGMSSPTPVAYDVIAWTNSGKTLVYASVSSDGTVH